MNHLVLTHSTEHSGATLEVRDVVFEYPGRGLFAKPFRALNGVSLEIRPGETLGLVGESGSGKSTLGRAILGLGQIASGSIKWKGSAISDRRRGELSAEIQVIFQDPYSSLNPVMKIEHIITEPLTVRHQLSHEDAREKALGVLDRVGMPADTLDRLPHEFSGGQRQRIAIARALIVDPLLVICDEPVSSLDVSTQAKVVDLLTEIQKERGLAYLFISHDISLVRRISHRMAVMYRGRVVEQGDAAVVGENPEHPYTQRLLLATPVPDPQLQAERRLQRQSMNWAHNGHSEMSTSGGDTR